MSINLIINFIATCIIIYVGYRDIKKGITVYLICTFILPVFNIGGLTCNFDFLVFPIIFIMGGEYILSKKKTLSIKKNKFVPGLVLYFIYYVIITLVVTMIHKEGLDIVNYYAIVRFFFTFIIVREIFDDDIYQCVDRVLTVVLIVNFIFAIIQMIDLLPVQIFYTFYYKTSMTPLKEVLKLGYFHRAYGATGSPVLLGTIAVMSFAFYCSLIMSKRKYGEFKLVLLKIIMAVLCGLLALSKTAILAIPICFIVIGFIKLVFGEVSVKSLRNLGLGALFLIIFLIIIFIIVEILRNNGFAIDYYLKFLKNPFEALSSRYDTETGILAETMQVIKDNWLFGVGQQRFEGVFIGDSSYVGLLYATGIIGFSMYFIPFAWKAFEDLKKKELLPLITSFAFLLISISNSLEFSYIVLPFLSVVFYEKTESES